MAVVLVNCDFDMHYVGEPMSTSALAATLRQAGFDVEVVDPTLYAWSVEQTADAIVAKTARFVGLSLLWDKEAANVARLLRLLRERGCGAFLAIGGHAPSLAAYALWKEQEAQRTASGVIQLGRRGEAKTALFDRSPEYESMLSSADTMMVGEADLALPDLVRVVLDGGEWRGFPGLIYRQSDGQLVRNPPVPKIESLSSLPHMARDVLAKHVESYGSSVPAAILRSRGCFYRCTFCSIAQYQTLQDGAKHRWRDNDDVISEITAVHDRFGIKRFSFLDDNFVDRSRRGTEELIRLCEKFCALPFKFEFAIYARADAVRREVFEQLKRAGLTNIFMGIESVHADDLEFFHKDSDPAVNHAALELLEDIGYSASVDSRLRIRPGYITWHPLTTIESLKTAVAFARKFQTSPSLLKKQLILFAETAALARVKELGLTAPGLSRGWSFRDARMTDLFETVTSFFKVAEPAKDQLRNIEKSARRPGCTVSELAATIEMRKTLDRLMLDFVDELLDVAAGASDGEFSSAVRTFESERHRTIRATCGEEYERLVAIGCAECEIPRGEPVWNYSVM
jgi:methylmalonyl-CoA mutase cobalamin-binding subunit